MQLPQKVSSLLREAEAGSGGRRQSYGNRDWGADPRNKARALILWQFPVLLSMTRVLFLIYPHQVPLERVTGVGEQESLTYGWEKKSMSPEPDTSDLKLGVAASQL